MLERRGGGARGESEREEEGNKRREGRARGERE
jgi:hypothetical protein